MEVKKLYNLIRDKNFDFFRENSLTGNNDLDNFIRKCVDREVT